MLIPKNNIFLVIGLLGPYFETRHYFRHQNNHDVIIKIVSINIVNGTAFVIHNPFQRPLFTPRRGGGGRETSIVGNMGTCTKFWYLL